MRDDPEERCDDPAVPLARNTARQAQESLFTRPASLRGATATALTFVACGGKGEHTTVVVFRVVRPCARRSIYTWSYTP
jgi:hypothetical protein